MKLLQEMIGLIKARTDEAFIRPPDPYGTKYPSSTKGRIDFDIDVPEIKATKDIYPFLTMKDGVIDALKKAGIDAEVGSNQFNVSLHTKDTTSDHLKVEFEKIAKAQGVGYKNLKAGVK